MKKVIVVLFAAALVFGLAGTASAKKLPPKVIIGFEKDSDFTSIFKENNGNKDYPIEKVTENVTEGKFAAKITFPNDGDWPGPHFKKFDGNWEGYDLMKIDVFNPAKEIVALSFAAIDKDAKVTKENYFGEYGLRYHAGTILKPGKNTFEIELSGATVEDKSRALELGSVIEFAIFVSSRPKDFSLFIDNIRIEQNEE